MIPTANPFAMPPRSTPARPSSSRARGEPQAPSAEDAPKPPGPAGDLFAKMKAARPDIAKILAQLDSGELDAIGDRKAIMATLLCNASAMDDRDGVELLLGRGMDVNAIDERALSKPSPLICAAMVGAPGTLALLLERGADPTIEDATGHTAAYWAEQKGHTAVVEMLAAAPKPAAKSAKSAAKSASKTQPTPQPEPKPAAPSP